MMANRNWFANTIFLLLFLLLVPPKAAAADDTDSIKLELTHRHGAGAGLKPLPHRLKDLVRQDILRHGIILGGRRLVETPSLRRRRRRRREANVSIEMPVGAGRDLGVGQYITTLKVGTPPQEFRVILNTGTDLSWINCRFRCGEGDDCGKGRSRVFDARKSTSFRTIPCLSKMCKVELMNLFSLKACPAPKSPCAYDFRYVDQSSAKGVFADESITVDLTNGRTTKLHNVLIGCTDSVRGQILENVEVDGLMGLANSKYSFLTKAAQNFGGKFSYCLVDHLSHANASNYLIFGSNKNHVKMSGITRHTNLDLSSIPASYAVNVVGISINGKMLHIPSQVWDTKVGGGMVLDSGTSLTFLPDPAYQPVIAALKAALVKFRTVKLEGVPMEYCFNTTSPKFDWRLVPKLIIHFGDGARFEPHWDSYVIAAADGVRCLGFLPAGFLAVSVVGNIMQQRYLWEFDLEQSKLGFTPSSCT